MSRNLAIFGLVAFWLAAATAPSEAFWPRSQWLACSEAATAADYQRWRCWELDGYAGAIVPGYGGAPTELWRAPGGRRSIQRGGPVSRLG